MGNSKDVKSVEDELVWIYGSSLHQKTEKDFISYLAPIGCAVTAGVLVTGVYHFHKRDSKKQQMLMRYRVLAQGVTVGFAIVALFLSPNIREKLGRWG